jgi:hypothetical protein
MDTTSPLTHSPASVSLPVSPDDDSRFDRTASPSPAFPKETLQQCGVSRVVQIHVPTPSTRNLITFLEQAAALGYNTLHLTGADHNALEELITTSHTLGYLNTLTTSDTLPTPRILRHLDHITISIAGKPQTPYQRSAFARLQQNIAIISNYVTTLGFSHILRPDSWQMLSWLTDFAMQHKATVLHLHANELSKWEPLDLYRIFLAHFYLRRFAEPELLIQLDILHRDNIINNPNFFFHQDSIPERSAKGFSTFFKELTIDRKGDILPLGRESSSIFRIGNIHSNILLTTMAERFMEEKFGDIMELYNRTYRQILGSCDELFSWAKLIADASHQFEKINS